jgi:hypothetical protein
MKEREALINQTKAKNVEIGNTVKADTAKLQADLKKTIYAEQGANKRTGMQIAAQKEINTADLDSRERIAAVTANAALTTQQRLNIDKVHDNAKAQVKLEIDGGASYTPEQIQSRINVLTYTGLAQIGITIPNLATPAAAATGTLSKASKGGVRDYNPLIAK